MRKGKQVKSGDKINLTKAQWEKIQPYFEKEMGFRQAMAQMGEELHMANRALWLMIEGMLGTSDFICSIDGIEKSVRVLYKKRSVVFDEENEK